MAFSKRMAVLATPQRRALTAQQREYRVRLLRQYGANKQRVESYRRRLPDAVLELRIKRLELMQELIRVRIAEVGGVPKRWMLDCSGEQKCSGNEQRERAVAG